MPASRVAARALATSALALAAAWSSPASATVVKAMSLMDKAQEAPVILHAVVQGTETRWMVPGARVETVVTLEVIESIKGGFTRGERVTFRRGGGRIGDFEQTAPGLSQYEAGEEVIMFLEPFGATLVAIGIGIGKYEVEQRQNGRFVEHHPDVAVLRYHGDKASPDDIQPHEAMTPEPLPDFLKRLRSYVRGFGVKKVAEPGAVFEKRPALKKAN
ncbi:MAG: hypothetical protein RMA76_11405 [Deltaproteobacteria bacterium]|jgi:hypothetical protein